MAFILRFFDYFLPESMCTTPKDLMRGYVLLGMIWSNLLISVLTAFGLVFLLNLEENTLVALALDGACIVGYLCALLLLMKTESYTLSSNFMIAVLTAVILTGIQITGGNQESPILQLLLMIPLWGFLLLGLKTGVVWLLITMTLCAYTYVSGVYGFGHVQLLQSAEVVRAMDLMFQFVLIAVMGAVLIVYETLNGLLEKELHEEKVKLEHWASHDDLTGVPNRFEFFRRLKAHINEANERTQTVGVVYIDLDGFKPVNDTHGHHTGDELLRAVAERLQQTLRLSDTTARLGGDEFGLILPGIRVPDDIENIMPKILAAIRKPIHIDGEEIIVRGSCGVSVFPMHGEDYTDLCKYADTAMYRAKVRSDSYIIYENTMGVAVQ
ncbi:MAG: GGDEF domain-containing protein [Gammaproteobacteria bacterium]|nr:GGDEF domain-containing protein [Gammaproteobacteria bacterium]